VALIEVIILLFCLGWLISLAMIFGGATGWVYLFLRDTRAMRRRGQVLDSARIARLEL